MKRLPAYFYRTETGKEPVREWLQSLNRDDRKAVGEDVKLVEFGWPVGMPTCKPMGEGVFEIRTVLSGGRISRIFFCAEEGGMYLLHGIIKKTQKTPKGDLEIARKRRKNVLVWLNKA
ncbi:type II toxin-antitoxin system RelE/ParE family toxin [Desulfovibrio sulfodismutans]|uniref:Type II toxin-antitoxin system RelE/ParE family toxin n=1 Tax=Desulfolutivibrio sulfodismutans TaxID=63561 RepID=A0A7K3NNP8_9BACT|nr:type II toxin-antitoxin system RelE/ParE family toxin [Desulfolutivibrio sulfodismutans]NDY56819.1 type II toxin-antitoxin system RelE/ParE family toxin [Desulfolutivibrio sulfodismutans]QLA10958.1 type II toxin-antitoxin system RelE/ParE family toxin [Desulfolutivibrio sulfodismutans DSM 3696]